ncbi:hypothetical protein AJ79_03119 [Helicocarpus griseus UAMH5409]|uniref:Uncharacterized protein n=1 Tax=Helicocarpus griseus UAMH5409 TaxID=1447875 RepID=A0A2B7Y0Q1_9EURO|nr:hypothetical protein AJ79_03119 [Helicocarpus griseus UAMH5409]
MIEDMEGALEAACESRHIAIIEQLLDFAAGTGLQGQLGGAALVSTRDVSVAKLLIKKGADVNGFRSSDTAVGAACDLHNMEMIEFLQMARTSWDLSVTELLLSYGAKINPDNKNFDTALASACDFRPVEVMTYLENYNRDAITHGIGLGLLDDFGVGINEIFTVLIYRWWNRRFYQSAKFETFNLSGDCRSLMMSVHMAGILSHEDIMCDVKSACFNHEKLVELLLKHGANVSARGATRALQKASLRINHIKLIELLDWFDARVKFFKFRLPRSDLTFDKKEVVELLQRYGMVLKVFDESGKIVEPPPGSKVDTSNLDNYSTIILELLLEYGADDSELKDDSRYQAMKRKIEETNRHVDELVRTGRESELADIKDSRCARARYAKMQRKWKEEEKNGELNGLDEVETVALDEAVCMEPDGGNETGGL